MKKPLTYADAGVDIDKANNLVDAIGEIAKQTARAGVMSDIGGFGVGSDFAWHAWGLLGYRFSLFSKDNNAAVFGGYRALSWDYTDGSGEDKFEWDVTLYGPILGLQIGF